MRMGMSDGYHVFEWVIVLAVVGFAVWRVWRTYGPRPRSAAGTSAPGCGAGCPSCNHCAATPAASPPKREQPIEFRPRPR